MISSFPADMTSFPDKNRNDASPDIGTRDVFGFSVAVSSVEEMCSVLVERALAGEAPFLVAAADVHVMTRGVHEPEYGAVLERMDVICPDGMPVVWKLNRVRGGGPAERDERTLETLAARLAEKYPGFCLAGVYSPPFRSWSEKDLQDMRETIASSGANVVWVGLGCPKQERWMAEQKDLLPPAVYAGVGAAFAFHAGTVKRAPVWMQKNSLEWLYRICREPRRLLKRYVKHNSLFLWYVLTGR